MLSFKKYSTIFYLSFWLALKNTKALIGMSLFLVSCLMIFSFLWKVAAAKVGAVSFSAEALMWYIAFNEWVLISLPDTHLEIEEHLQSGCLAYLLSRPVSYLGSIFAASLGQLSVNLLILGGVAFGFTFYQTGALPADSAVFLCSILFGFLGGILGIIFQMLIGLSAFWIQNVEPFQWVWERLLFIFGGLILPLAIFPDWMQKLASLTPFPVILGDRSALFLHFTHDKVLFFLKMWILWMCLGGIFLLLCYRKGLRILNIQGG